MPLTSAEHARRLAMLLKGKDEGLTIEAIATRGGMYGASFYNWVKRYHPEHLPPPRAKAAHKPVHVNSIAPSKMLPADVVAHRVRVWNLGQENGLTWVAMAEAAGVSVGAWQEWVVRNIPDAVKAPKRPPSWIGDQSAVKNRSEHRPRAITTKTYTTRPCMTCGDPFKSAGPGNRLCSYCNSRAASSSPYEPEFGRAARQMPARRA